MVEKVKKHKVLKSPLRYPGGKGSVYPFFEEVLKLNNLIGAKYYEPFAGGAGIGIALLSLGIISEVLLNDIDYHIYCFWLSLLKDNERFVEKIENVHLSIDEWHKQKNIYLQPNTYSIFEVGFSTFFLNRCNRSGIISGSGPIGGYSQSGKWRMDARFNKSALISRFIEIGKMRNMISIKNNDAIVFLKDNFADDDINKSFIYIDPPYVSAGNRLYMNLYKNKDHKELAEYLLIIKLKHWILTYDDNVFIKELYDSCSKKIFYKRYSLQKRNVCNELLITPKTLLIPDGL